MRRRACRYPPPKKPKRIAMTAPVIALDVLAAGLYIEDVAMAVDKTVIKI